MILPTCAVVIAKTWLRIPHFDKFHPFLVLYLIIFEEVGAFFLYTDIYRFSLCKELYTLAFIMLPSYLQPFYWDSQAKSEHLKASGPSRPTESTIETESSYPRESQKAKPEHRKRPLEIGSTTDRTHHFEYQSDSSSKRARHTTDQTSVTKAPEFSVDDGHGSTSNTDVQTSSGQGKLREDPARLSKIGHWLDSYTSAVYHRPKGLRKERCHTKPSLSPESANRSEGASPILSDIITDANKALPEPIKTRAVESLGLPEQDQEWLKMARKEMEMATYITYLSDPSDDLAFECWKRAVSGGRAESVIPRPTSEIIGRVGLYLSYHDLEANPVSRLSNNSIRHVLILWNAVDRRSFHGTNFLKVTQNPWQAESAIFLTKKDFNAPKNTTMLVHILIALGTR